MQITRIKPVPPPPPPDQIQLTLSIEEAKILRQILGGISCPHNGPHRTFIIEAYDGLGDKGVNHNYVSCYDQDFPPVVKKDAKA